MSLAVAREEGFVEIALDWPSTKNALGPAEARELRLKIGELLASDEPPRAIVLSSSGKVFCSGGNLKIIAELVKEGRSQVESTIYAEFQGLFRAIRESSAVIIAAVDGPAIGLGCDLATAADLAFFGPGAWLSQGWMNVGLIPATGGLHSLSQKGGPQAVWRLLTEDRVSAQAAQEMGLGVAVDDARAAARSAAMKLGALPGRPLSAMRELVQITNFDRHLEKALEYQVGFLVQPTFQERVSEILLARGERSEAMPRA